MIQVTQDRVAIMMIPESNISSGGIIIPEIAQTRCKQGIIHSIGPGKRDEDGDLIPLGVKVSDYVIFPAFAGNVVRVDGAEYIIMLADEISAVIPLETIIVPGLYHTDADNNRIKATIDSAFDCILSALKSRGTI